VSQWNRPYSKAPPPSRQIDRKKWVISINAFLGLRRRTCKKAPENDVDLSQWLQVALVADSGATFPAEDL